MIDLEDIIKLKPYDLFITKTENNIIKEYSIYEDRHNMNIECIARFKVEVIELPYYVDNYKLENGSLVELTDEEKEAIVTPVTPDQNVILEEEVKTLKEELVLTNQYLTELELYVLENQHEGGV